MRIYIAGPMSNIADFNFPAFFAAEKQLQTAGYEVSNPARHGSGNGTWLDYMRKDMKDMLDCDGLALLPGWQDSRGAALEAHVARSLELPVMDVQSWVEEAA